MSNEVSEENTPRPRETDDAKRADYLDELAFMRKRACWRAAEKAQDER